MPVFRWLPSRRALLAATGLAPLLAACSSVAVFNAVMPFDGASERIAEGLAYGEDPRQRLDLYAPLQRSGPLPVVLFVYGGSWNAGDRGSYAFVGRGLAAQGFLAVVMDYRLVPQVRFPGFVEDAALATAWIRRGIAEHGGDPGRVAVMGHSAGAYIAAMVAVDPSYLQAAGVRGPAFRALVGLSGPYDFLPLDVDASVQAFGQAPDLARTQPVNVVASGAPPAFLGHGLDDTTVRPRNSERLATALHARGAPVTLKLYEGVSHASTIVGFARPFRGNPPVFGDVVAFLKSHVGPGAPGGA